MPEYKALFETKKITISINGQTLSVPKSFVADNFVASQVINKDSFVELYKFEIDVHEGVLGSDIIGVLLGFDPTHEQKKEVLLDAITFNMFHMIKKDLLINKFTTDLGEILLTKLSTKYMDLHKVMRHILGSQDVLEQYSQTIFKLCATELAKNIVGKCDKISYNETYSFISLFSDMNIFYDHSFSSGFMNLMYFVNACEPIDYASIVEGIIKKELVDIIESDALAGEIFEIYFRPRYRNVTINRNR